MAAALASPAAPRSPRRPVAPSGVVGMSIFILTEIMFFAGLISALTITRATALMGLWPPPGQPRLPVEETMLNTAALMVSGVALLVAHFRFKRDPAAVKAPLLFSMALGAVFVILQGVEWVGMLAQGLTMTSSAHGSFFYLLVGSHALHAVAALIGLGYVALRAMQGRLLASQLYTAELFWYFVVLLWPIIYARVYF
jgi:cytochrome c oxidase subunit 3